MEKQKQNPTQTKTISPVIAKGIFHVLQNTTNLEFGLN